MKPGDLVRLKSGGPVMTVEAAWHQSGRCKWFLGGAIQSSDFEFSALVEASRVDENGRKRRLAAEMLDDICAMSPLEQKTLVMFINKWLELHP